MQPNSATTQKKLLVAARCDRGGISLSRERLTAVASKLGYSHVFGTSAKDGLQIPELIRALHEEIDWENLPWVGSNDLFQILQAFLISEKKARRVLTTADDLFRAFQSADPVLPRASDLRPSFDTCIGRVEHRDLVRRMRFGGYILLQPELLDAYASAIVNAAKTEPDGLGCIAEVAALAGDFYMSADERIADADLERLLLIATVEELLKHDLALKEIADDEVDLIFPSQFTRERPDAPDLPGKAGIFLFDGPVLSIYATLAVRLARSQYFKKEMMWKNAATYRATVGGVCGIALHELEEGRAELSLFFDSDTAQQTRLQFENFVATHLKRRLGEGDFTWQPVFSCEGCGTEITPQQRHRRLERGLKSSPCPVCEREVSLLDAVEKIAAAASAGAKGKIRMSGSVVDPIAAHENRERIVAQAKSEVKAAVATMDRAADAHRARDTAAIILKGKEQVGDFDVFLCHNSEDKPAVQGIRHDLRAAGILPWLDEEQIAAGQSWMEAIETQIRKVKAVAVFFGSGGSGPWHDQERQAFLAEAIKREVLVIPVILPGVVGMPELPPLLSSRAWVDFRRLETRPLERLVQAIGTRMAEF